MNKQGIFVAIYRWKIKSGKEELFKSAWAKMTKLILENCGSLGSRLHLGEDGIWYAYAQWPSKEAWERSSLEIPQALEARSQMKEAIEESLASSLLEVTDDYLV